MFSQQINTTFDTSLLCPQRNRINSSAVASNPPRIILQPQIHLQLHLRPPPPALAACFDLPHQVLSWCQKCLAIRRLTVHRRLLWLWLWSWPEAGGSSQLGLLTHSLKRIKLFAITVRHCCCCCCCCCSCCFSWPASKARHFIYTHYCCCCCCYCCSWQSWSRTRLMAFLFACGSATSLVRSSARFAVSYEK